MPKPDTAYLHRGTRTGARRLGLKTEGATLDVAALPEGVAGELIVRSETARFTKRAAMKN